MDPPPAPWTHPLVHGRIPSSMDTKVHHKRDKIVLVPTDALKFGTFYSFNTDNVAS